MSATWRFKPMVPGDLNVDPFEREFFATEALDSTTDPLVREAIQNSLDAGAGESVNVRFALGQARAASKERYLKALLPHVNAALNGTSKPLSDSEPFTFLVVEDEGTRGLCGDPTQYEDEETLGTRNDFYYFWRNVGRSRKESADRGRWGLGKTVFAAASRLQAFFGLTVREDRRSLLMGQAVLKIHRVGTNRYQPYGYYGRNDGGLSLPIEDAGAISEFERSFGLRRSSTAGLSIVVPYPDPAITADEIVRSVLRHYFYPLLSGDLRVVIEDGTSHVQLEQANLEREILRYSREHFQAILPLLELARWGLEAEQEAIAILEAPASGRAPRLTAELFTPADLERLRKRYDEGRRIALDVPLCIQSAHGESAWTAFRLLLERDDKITRGEGHFVRQGITIENSSARRPRGVRWVVVISDERLSAFLGDAENPAHTEWQRNSPKFKEKYRLGPSTLDFVKSAPHNVVSILSRPAEGRDPELLRNIFSLSKEAAMTLPSAPKPAGGVSDESSTTDADLGEFGRGGRLVLSRVKTGFRLSGHVGEGAPDGLRILAAYEVLRGNAFRRYSPLDFQVEAKPIAAKARGVNVTSRANNMIELAVQDADFELLVTGFDVHRDLRVKVQPLHNSE